jgi:2-polyprenyl-6-methoxyphenol hydroxylase-like FAD-dependent oxidoreductase
MADRGRTAVVLGSSLAGMFAAAALARHAERVVVVERDALPEDAQWRRGVPQSRHAHNLMMAGHTAMASLFPGIQEELVAAGMVRVRMPQDMWLMTPGGWMPRFPTSLVMLTSSRDLIDMVVRRRIAADPRIETLQETEALGLLATPDGKAVRGVTVRPRGEDPYELAADFVVDATGRTSRTPEWLVELGYPKVTEQVVDAKTAYSTAVFDPPPGHTADWNCLLLQASKDNPRQGILNPIENGRWMVSLAALGGTRPPTDHEGFLEYCRLLRSTELHDVLEKATPVGPVHASGRTENRRRFYEKLDRWPDRFLAVGDGVCALNPSYGQGMSVAAPTAVAVGDALAKAGTFEGVAGRLRKVVARSVGPAWQLATTADFNYPWTADKTDLQTKVALRYLYRVLAVSPTSQAASQALLDVNQMVATPNAVFRPAVVAAVLRGPRPGPTAPPPLQGDPVPPPALNPAQEVS